MNARASQPERAPDTALEAMRQRYFTARRRVFVCHPGGRPHQIPAPAPQEGERR